MHYAVGVVIDPSYATSLDHAKQAVTKILAPFEETWDDEAETHHGWWDWWQIGGRYSGRWDPDYDPAKDERNWRVCYLCSGTGNRTDERGRKMGLDDGRCNGCRPLGAEQDKSQRSTGRMLEWPIGWAPHPGDVVRVGDLLDRTDDDWSVFRLVLPDTGIIERRTWDDKNENFIDHPGAEQWGKVLREALEPFREACIVVVDCHD